MKMSHFQLKNRWVNTLMALILLCGLLTVSSCKDDDGLTEGDPNYLTSSRGQFTATLSDGTVLYLLPGATPGTAIVTYDGAKSLHTVSTNTLTIWVDSYQDDLDLSLPVTGSDGQSYTLTAIGQEAFMGCRKFSTFNSNGLTSITLPASITTLGEGAFCFTSLKKLDLTGTSITSIPQGCFGECDSLKKVVIPGTVTSIGKMAFTGCDSLKAVTLSEGLKSIGERAFYRCSKLRTLDGTDGTAKVNSKLSLPTTVSSIGKMAFASMSCDTLDLSASAVTEIPEGMLQACTNLTGIELPATLKRIGTKAFYDCRNAKFEKVYIPASVTSIGDKAFGGRGDELSSSTGNTTYWYSFVKEFHLLGSTPPTLEGVLYETKLGNPAPTVYVPAGSKDAYLSAPGWRTLNIVEE